MPTESPTPVCWIPIWNDAQRGVGLEHLLLSRERADSVVLGVDPDAGPFRLAYQLAWDTQWQLRSAELCIAIGGQTLSLGLRADGQGRWQLRDGTPRPDLNGCIDIDIWPTPFTNSFPIRRRTLLVGERSTFTMAWVSALDMEVRAQPQAYTRLEQNLYRFENLDGTGFQADLTTDSHGLVVDYPGLFRRLMFR